MSLSMTLSDLERIPNLVKLHSMLCFTNSDQIRHDNRRGGEVCFSGSAMSNQRGGPPALRNSSWDLAFDLDERLMRNLFAVNIFFIKKRFRNTLLSARGGYRGDVLKLCWHNYTVGYTSRSEHGVGLETGELTSRFCSIGVGVSTI